jgi:two-component system, NtrC family, sensor histidine kinase KinB
MSQDSSRSSLELLYNISRELAMAIDLHTVLDRVLFLSIHNVGAERGTLIVLDDQLNPLESAIYYRNQIVSSDQRPLRETLEQGLAGWVLRNRQPALLPDTSKDDRWLRRPDDEVEQSGPKSAICIPLLSRDQITGILTIVHPEPGFFNKEHLALLQSIADQAGIAVYNARLYDSLQSATRRYRELFEDSIDPILITDRSGKIIEANRRAARMTGFQRSELRALSIFDLHTANLDRLGDEFSNLVDGRTVTYESNLRTHNEANVREAHIPVEVYVREAQIDGDLNLQWTLHDLTERKALDALHEDLSAMIYHDLRSPLANIVSSLDMLGTLIPIEEADTALKSVFSIAVRSTDRMQRLISSLLDINRLESGQPITNQQITNAADLVTDALDAIRPMTESKLLKVEVSIAADFPRLWVDADMIRRVLINLLENATKFTPVEGKIQVGASRQDDGVRLWVKDSGPGIPAEAQESIFEKFIRLQAERFPKGVGLGLAFCRLAVQAHGGKIWVESLPGSGSCFIFTLPIASM